MTTPFRVACVQVSAGTALGRNIEFAADLIGKAAAAGAQLVCTPENVTMIEQGRAAILAKAHPEETHPALPRFAALARDRGIWLLVGSLTIRLDGDRAANRSFLIDDRGTIVARYDKIHMFDVDLPGGERYRESATFQAGDQAVLAGTPWGPLGLTVCYDVRFPQLYRVLAKAGARYLTVPSAFTRVTGQAHWHVLLRARAIETGCFVFAPAQCGTHVGGRWTFGHSLIVAPWGEVLADGGDIPGYVIATIDPAKVDDARGMVPALTHDRAFAAPEPVRAHAEA